MPSSMPFDFSFSFHPSVTLVPGKTPLARSATELIEKLAESK